MKKSIYIHLLLCLFICESAYSQIVSRETAQRVAENFFDEISTGNRGKTLSVYLGGDEEHPSMYAFSLPDQWVLIAADKRVQPILAYSDNNGGIFPSKEDMPDGMLYLLEWYDEQIDSLRHENRSRNAHPLWDMYLTDNNSAIIDRSVIVGPLLTRNGNENIWKQSGNNNGNDITKSYNKFCPARHDTTQNCDHTIVGCVALATSQVLWYWQWPHVAIVADDNGNQLLRNYDWSKIPYKLTNTTTLDEANMVANLLHDVGVSVNMNYGCSGSSAVPSRIPNALRNKFYYNSDNLKYRSNYADSIWLNLIKGELTELCPVLYGGQSTTGGHRFVIDGYDSSDFFHVNYGWGGSSNGYYSLNNVNYNTSQSIVMNIRPNYLSCSPLIVPSTDVWLNIFVIQNGGAITIGDRIVSNGMQGAVLSGESITLSSGFSVQAGAYLYLDIKDMPCEEDLISFSNAPVYKPIQDGRNADQRESILPHQPLKILHNGQVLILRGNRTYTVTGQEVK